MSSEHQNTVRAFLDADDNGEMMVMRLYETGSPGAWLTSDYTVEVEQ